MLIHNSFRESTLAGMDGDLRQKMAGWTSLSPNFCELRIRHSVTLYDDRRKSLESNPLELSVRFFFCREMIMVIFVSIFEKQIDKKGDPL